MGPLVQIQSFPKNKLREVIWEDGVTLDDGSELEKVENEMSSTGRWSIHYWLTFKHVDGDVEKYYSVNYSIGATELQDESPFEFSGDDILCYEVEPREVKTIHYFQIEVKE